MHYTFLFLLTFCLLGCGVDDIDWDTTDPEPYQAEVVALVDAEFQVETRPTIYWTDTPCPHSDEQPTAVVYRGECYHGLTFGCQEIYVARRSSLAESALVHELGHCARLALGMPGDFEHEDLPWWERARAANDEVRENGW